MRRADRLFQIVQLVRARGLTTAAALARELEVSPRTIYRDVADLVASGVPIEGEAGVGYLLPRRFDLPPLMFNRQEVEALVLGARMVEAWGGAELAGRARSVLAKVQNVLPEKLATRLDAVALYAPGFFVPKELTANLEPLRQAVDARRKVRFDYTRADGVESQRTVRPLGLFFWGNSWSLVAWCELRVDFRSFRPDRMRDLRVLDAAWSDEPGEALTDYLRRIGSE